MEILEMIEEWRKGCSLSPHNPLECTACTEALIDAIENKEKLAAFSGCITPKFYLIVDRLRNAASNNPKTGDEIESDKSRIVHQNDIAALLHEFFRLNAELRKLKPHVFVEELEESHRVC